MRKDIAEALLIITVSTIIFFVLKPHIFYKENEEEFLPEKYPLPIISETELAKNPKATDALKALNAWIKAYNDGQESEFLNELNKEIVVKYGVRIVQKNDGTLLAKDLDENIILKV